MSVVASQLIAQVKVEGDTEAKQKLGEVSASVDKAGGVIGGLKGAFSGAFAWVSEGGLSNVISAFDTVRTSVGGLLQSAGNFQASITSLSTGAGELSSNLGLVSAGVLKTAVDTGTATSDLSAGLYLIDSAGQKGEQSLTTLTAAAEGAKVGAASLADVANGVTTEMTDYASSGLTAAQATNTLITAVSLGKTHMGDLSQAMSTILPTSAALHVSLDDTAGAMATMTGEGTDAASAATYLRQLLMALEAPAKAGASALKDIGLTTGEVAAEMRVSLPDTLKMIMDHLAQTYKVGSPQYVEALKNIAGGSKQMQGILELTGTHLSTFGDNVKGVTDAVNKGGTSIIGWDKVQDDLNFKLEKAQEVVETLGIKVGTALIPVVDRLLDVATPLADRFSDWLSSLDQVGAAFQQVFEPIQKTTAAAKPLLDTFDRATALLPKTTAATKPLLDTFDRATAIIKNTTQAVNPLVAIFQYWKPVIEDVGKDVEILAGDVETFATGIGDAVAQSGLFQSALQFLHDELPVVGTFLVNAGDAINQNLLPPLESLITNVGSAAAGFITWADQSGVANTAISTLGSAIQLTTEILGPLIQAVSDVIGWLGGGGAGTDTLVFALSAAATAFALLKIADTTAQFGSFISKLQEGDGIITNLASSVKDKLAKAFDDFLSNQAPHLKKSLDDAKASADAAATSEEKVGDTAKGDMAAGVTSGATESETALAGISTSAGEVEAAEAGIGTAAEGSMATGVAAGAAESESSLSAIAVSASEVQAAEGGIGTVAETTMAEGVAAGAAESEASLAGVGASADAAKTQVAGVGTQAESTAATGGSAISGLGGIIGGLVVGIALMANQWAYATTSSKSFIDQFQSGDWLGDLEYIVALGTPGGELGQVVSAFHKLGVEMGWVKDSSQDMSKNVSSSTATMDKNATATTQNMAANVLTSTNTMGKSVSNAAQTMYKDVVQDMTAMQKQSIAQGATLSSGMQNLFNTLSQNADGTFSQMSNDAYDYLKNVEDYVSQAQAKALSKQIGAGGGNILNKNFNGYASGTDYVPRAGTYLVGERGPEVVNLPRGAQVIPNDQLSRGGSGWGGGGGNNQPIQVNLNVDGETFASLMVDHMGNAVAQNTRLRYGRRAW